MATDGRRWRTGGWGLMVGCGGCGELGEWGNDVVSEDDKWWGVLGIGARVFLFFFFY